MFMLAASTALGSMMTAARGVSREAAKGPGVYVATSAFDFVDMAIYL
jgi:hypothetical protein